MSFLSVQHNIFLYIEKTPYILEFSVIIITILDCYDSNVVHCLLIIEV